MTKSDKIKWSAAEGDTPQADTQQLACSAEPEPFVLVVIAALWQDPPAKPHAGQSPTLLLSLML